MLPEDPFFVAGRSPAWGETVSASDDVEVRFAGGEVDPATAVGGVHAIEPGGVPVAVDVEVAGGTVVVHPPITGWVDGTTIQLDAGVRSVEGSALFVPFAIQLEVTGG